MYAIRSYYADKRPRQRIEPIGITLPGPDRQLGHRLLDPPGTALQRQGLTERQDHVAFPTGAPDHGPIQCGAGEATAPETAQVERHYRHPLQPIEAGQPLEAALELAELPAVADRPLRKQADHPALAQQRRNNFV